MVMRNFMRFRAFSSTVTKWKGVVVGKIERVDPHPMADKLKLCQVRLNGQEQVQIVCGASNVAVGQYVPVATIGTRLEIQGKMLKIKKSKLRGEFSHGMICSRNELGLSSTEEEDRGIMVLSENAEVGSTLDEIQDAL